MSHNIEIGKFFYFIGWIFFIIFAQIFFIDRIKITRKLILWAWNSFFVRIFLAELYHFKRKKSFLILMPTKQPNNLEKQKKSKLMQKDATFMYNAHNSRIYTLTTFVSVFNLGKNAKKRRV